MGLEFFNFVTFYFYISIHSKKNGIGILQPLKMLVKSRVSKTNFFILLFRIFIITHYCIYNNNKNGFNPYKH